MSPILAANTVTVALYYSKNFTDVALLTGYHLLGVGLAGILCVPTARVWGKRHLFIIGNVLMIISCVWAGASSNSYRSLTAARVFQGFALAPFEALVNTCVGDLYFVHVSLLLPFIGLVVLMAIFRSVESAWLSQTWHSLEDHF
jgi:MFS family permease